MVSGSGIGRGEPPNQATCIVGGECQPEATRPCALLPCALCGGGVVGWWGVGVTKSVCFCNGLAGRVSVKI